MRKWRVVVVVISAQEQQARADLLLNTRARNEQEQLEQVQAKENNAQ
jgi:hypothetical protein